MLCENCGKRKAEIHLVKVINGVRMEEDICRECAEKLMPFHEAAKALKMSFSLDGIMNVEGALRNLLLPMLPELYEIEGKEMRCPHCGEKINADELFGRLESEQGTDTNIVFDFSHTGGLSGETNGGKEKKQATAQAPASDLEVKNQPGAPEKELSALKKELEFVLRGEKYERAAEIRDRVIELEKNIRENTEGA